MEYPYLQYEIMADLHELELEITAGLAELGDAVMARLGVSHNNLQMEAIIRLWASRTK